MLRLEFLLLCGGFFLAVRIWGVAGEPLTSHLLAAGEKANRQLF